MDQRLKLQELLESLVGEGGKVYFQPPGNLTMTYPCIVYQRSTAETRFAGNFPYNRHKRYSVTVIDRNSDSPIPDRVASLPMCTHSAFFVTENLNHDVFNLYF